MTTMGSSNNYGDDMTEPQSSYHQHGAAASCAAIPASSPPHRVAHGNSQSCRTQRSPSRLRFPRSKMAARLRRPRTLSDLFYLLLRFRSSPSIRSRNSILTLLVTMRTLDTGHAPAPNMCPVSRCCYNNMVTISLLSSRVSTTHVPRV